MKRKPFDNLDSVGKKRKCQEKQNNNNNNSENETENNITNGDESLAEEKKEEFVLTKEIADNVIITDISGNKWRIGAPVGKGSFGEIFLASNITNRPVDRKNAQHVAKIEPHSNGPLFVEIHCLLNVNKQNEMKEDETTVGIPKYIASGSHYFSERRYRFLVMPRFKSDLHSITKLGRLHPKHFLIVCSQIIDVLKLLHEKHYVHSDLKAENIMIGLYDNNETDVDENDRVFVIDYGLATKFIDTNGEHRPFCMDQRRAHDGTLEFTSRDAHFGAHSRRSDLECLGYNLIYWSQGFLPWKDEKLQNQPEIVHRLKELFMTDVKEMLKLFYGKDVPKYLGEYMQYVGTLEFDAEPDYKYLKGLFEREFLKLGYELTDMKLKLADMKNDCQQFAKNLSETELMMSVITDLKTVKKLGFFGDNIENGVQHLTKPIDNLNFNLTSKMSPKNLRSKIEKVTTGAKKPKRVPKTDKDLITTKIAQGKKLSIIEIASLDPDKIARDRAEREYERFDDKLYYQTPQKYNGNPTYAILEIENRLKSKQSGCVVVNDDTNKEVIKGYTKQMMDVLRKQQLIVEQQMSPITHKKRSREGLRNVIKQTRKSMSYRNGMIEKKECKKNRISMSPALTPRLKRGRPKRTRLVETVQQEEDEEPVTDNEVVETIIIETPVLKNKRKRGRPSKHIQKPCTSIIVVQDSEEEAVQESEEEEEVVVESESEAEEEGVLESEVEEDCFNESDEEEIVAPESDVESEVESEIEPEVIPEPPVVKRSRGRPKRVVISMPVRKEVEPSVTEEVASNNGETSDQESAVSSNLLGPHRLRKKPKTLRYYRDNDFVLSTDDSSHSSASNATSMKRARGKTQANADVGILTRNKIKSRSSSRSHPDIQEVEEEEEEEEEDDEEDEDDESIVADDDVNDDESECINESAQGSEDGDQEETFYESEMEESEDEKSVSESESNDDENSSVDIKYSPIKTRHARTHNDEANPRRRWKIYNSLLEDFHSISARG
ncbi:unnamed protein product [Diamesa tonsa]